MNELFFLNKINFLLNNIMTESNNLTFSKLDYTNKPEIRMIDSDNILTIERLQKGGHKNNSYYTYNYDSIQCKIINYIKMFIYIIDIKTIIDNSRPDTQISQKQIIGGDNNKKNIVRLYNCYVLSQDQNDLSYKIKKIR
jgi:hypothetical protein